MHRWLLVVCWHQLITTAWGGVNLGWCFTMDLALVATE
jgi:hypothetical protein